MKYLLIFILFWLLCGAFDYAFSFAYMQRKYSEIAEKNYNADRRSAVVGGLLFGPIGLLISFSLGWTRYGLKWR